MSTHASGGDGSQPRIAVAIPVKDEADCIGACLNAVAGQVGARIDHVVLLLNNCRDGSAETAGRVRMPRGTTVHIVECDLEPEFANAGHARRLAMDEAARLLGPGDILMTTDADGLVEPDWVAASLAAFAQGADVVAGQAELHPADWSRIPMRLHEDDARECAYDALLDKIHARLDPDPFDPEPRHTQHSGASLAVRVDAFWRCGGVPRVASGEDRALVAALRAIDARIRHAPEVRVVVSGRIVGRASGGMADTIRRRLDRPDEFLDERLEPAVDCARRARARAGLRQVRAGHLDPALLAFDLGLARLDAFSASAHRHFGQAWDALERETPVLRRSRVAVADLPAEMAHAQAILAGVDQWQTECAVQGD